MIAGVLTETSAKAEPISMKMTITAIGVSEQLFEIKVKVLKIRHACRVESIKQNLCTSAIFSPILRNLHRMSDSSWETI